MKANFGRLRPVRAGLGIPIGLVGLAACGDMASEVHPVVAALQAPATYRIERMGESDPGLPLGLIADVEMATGGRVFIADVLAPQIVVLGADALYLETWERRGEGPGEFRTIGGLAMMAGDTLLAYDPVLGRVTLLDSATGSLVGTTSVARGVARIPARVFPVAGGSLVAWERAPYRLEAAASPERERSDAIHLVDRFGGRAPEALLRFPSRQGWVLRGDGGMTALDDPFGSQPLVQVGPEGRIYRMSSDALALTAHDLDGARLWRWEVDLPADAASESEFEVVTELLSEEMDESPLLAPILDSLRISAGQLPLVTGLVVDDTGHLWVGVRARDVPQGRWLHLTAEGGVLGTVDLPPEELIGRVRHDRIVTVPRVPPWDVPVVRVYRVIRP